MSREGQFGSFRVAGRSVWVLSGHAGRLTRVKEESSEVMEAESIRVTLRFSEAERPVQDTRGRETVKSGQGKSEGQRTNSGHGSQSR